jgi:hypothetical protein
MLAGIGCLLRMGKLRMVAFPLQMNINDSMNTTGDCNCIARKNARNNGMLPSSRPAGATTDSAQGFHNGNKKRVSLHIDCSNRAVFPWDVTKIANITQICAKIYPHLTII